MSRHLPAAPEHRMLRPPLPLQPLLQPMLAQLQQRATRPLQLLQPAPPIKRYTMHDINDERMLLQMRIRCISDEVTRPRCKSHQAGAHSSSAGCDGRECSSISRSNCAGHNSVQCGEWCRYSSFGRHRAALSASTPHRCAHTCPLPHTCGVRLLMCLPGAAAPERGKLQAFPHSLCLSSSCCLAVELQNHVTPSSSSDLLLPALVGASHQREPCKCCGVRRSWRRQRHHLRCIQHWCVTDPLQTPRCKWIQHQCWMEMCACMAWRQQNEPWPITTQPLRSCNASTLALCVGELHLCSFPPTM